LDGGGKWIDLAHDRDRWRAIANAVIKLMVAEWNFLTMEQVKVFFICLSNSFFIEKVIVGFSAIKTPLKDYYYLWFIIL
jgi:hypothetical protein